MFGSLASLFSGGRRGLFLVSGQVGYGRIAMSEQAVALSSDLPWEPFPSAVFPGTDVLICIGLVFYAWVLQQNFREIGGIFGYLFNFRDIGKAKGSMASARVARLRNTVFFLLSVLTLFWLTYTFQRFGSVIFEKFPLCLFSGTEDAESRLRVRCLAFALSFYAVKWLVLRLVSGVFAEKKFGLFVWRTGLYYDLSFSLAALPLLAVALYMDTSWIKPIMWVLLIFASISFVIRILKIVLAGKNFSRFSHLHIFSYFCALEILSFVSFWQVFFCVEIL